MSTGRVSIATDYLSEILGGVPFDHLNTPIFDPALRDLLGLREVLSRVMQDRDPLPTTEAREGYFGPRHLEYWLSGYRDAQHVVNATHLASRSQARILDFGGASGRVVRHFSTWCPNALLFLSDINPKHVRLVQSLFGGRICALRNQGIPSLPFPDGFLDVVTAFSVFTHMDADDTAWLLELRRIVKPGGHLYITVHDERTWEKLPTLAPMGAAFTAPELLAVRDKQPELLDKVVHFYNASSDYNCNAFVSRKYIERIWRPLFTSLEIASLRHDHQAAVILGV